MQKLKNRGHRKGAGLGPVLVILVFCFYGILHTSCRKGNNSEIPSPPNVLFISVDNLRPDLGIYGNDIVKSPHLNKLAKDGLAFTRHYVQAPTCGASRYSLLTGLFPIDTLHIKNDIISKTISKAAENKIPESFVHLLRRNGYYTVGIGKISHSADGLVYGYEEEPSDKRELPYSWDERLFDAGKWGTGWNAFFGYANGDNRQGLKKQVKPYEIGDVGDEGYPDGLTTQLALTKLKELKDRKQPFFLGVGFFKPHLPFTAPKKYWDLYKREDIQTVKDSLVPVNVNNESLHNSSEFNKGYHLSDEKPSLTYGLSQSYSKKLIHAYYAGVSYVDAQIGKILNQLESLNLKDDTIVIVWGDHGYHLGNKRVWGKHTLFETALRSALIIKVPGAKTSNIKNETILETIDIYPTLMELCGIEIEHQIDGESFKEILFQPEMIKSDTAISYYNHGVSMRTDRYRITKYFRKEKPKIELYDHKLDSLETINIASKEASVIKELMPALRKNYNGMYGPFE